MNLIGAAREHFVDVALVRNIEHEFVIGRGENAVKRQAQLDNTEIWAEVTTRF